MRTNASAVTLIAAVALAAGCGTEAPTSPSTVVTTAAPAGPTPSSNGTPQPIKRVTAGGSIVLSLTPENGRCSGWLYLPCASVRVAVLADGKLTVEAVPTQVTQEVPAVLVCCVSGDEVYGNPVTLPVTAGTEMWVEVGQSRSGGTINEVTVKTRFEPF